METILIVPIGGLLAAMGVLLVLGVIWLWNLASENVDAITRYANESTDTVVLVIGLIVLAICIFITIFMYGSAYCQRIKKNGVSAPHAIFMVLIRAIVMAIPFTMGLSTVYAWIMQMTDAIIGIIAESVLMWIAVPLVALFALFGVVVGLFPMGPLLLSELGAASAGDDTEQEEGAFGFWITALFELLGIGVYLLLMFTCTDLPEYLYNSFGAW